MKRATIATTRAAIRGDGHKTLRVRHATRAAKSPASQARIIQTEVNGLLNHKSCGQMIAESTGMGTRRRILKQKWGYLVLAKKNNIKERRVPKVASPMATITARCHDTLLSPFQSAAEFELGGAGHFSPVSPALDQQAKGLCPETWRRQAGVERESHSRTAARPATPAATTSERF